MTSEQTTCPDCQGEGFFDSLRDDQPYDAPCPTCEGAGTISKEGE